MKRTFLTIAFVAFWSSMAFAGGHGLFSQTAFVTTTDEHIVEGTTGHMVSAQNESIWDWRNAPEGWPRAAKATCQESHVLSVDKKPLLGSWSCELVDVDGDVGLWVGDWNMSSHSTGRMLGGTGKYADATEGTFDLKRIFTDGKFRVLEGTPSQ
jgi:hypothetical protein